MASKIDELEILQRRVEAARLAGATVEVKEKGSSVWIKLTGQLRESKNYLMNRLIWLVAH